MDFATRAIHAGQDADPTTGATIVPIYATSTYTQTAVGEHKGFDYSRVSNPTRLSLETQLAALEEARHCVAFGSGLGAESAITSLLSAGDHVVVSDDTYGGTYRLFTRVLDRFGLESTFVDMTDLAAVREAIRPNTKMFWLETPTNPMLRIIDIAAIAALRTNGELVVVDNTFCTPYFQSPLALGADIAVYSATKYIGGHSDVIGGAAITNDDGIAENLRFLGKTLGATLGPFDAFLITRGAKTLALRMREHEHNAHAIAHFLTERDDVSEVFYPGLASHPQHELARKQMRGFGGIISLTLRGPESRALEVAKRTKLFSLAESLGGVESLINHPARMTHGSIPKEERDRRGITDGLLRLSVGIESASDLIADLRQALDATIALAGVTANGADAGVGDPDRIPATQNEGAPTA
ncbi:MAG: cystathionine beta-lyase/cystathionine gamma-synthase [Candidatus Eremiobacteraeota bacterium]|nr:cystathionine beta-lyase/cystathionine gamma-synthase [Candidatus Eremiobacteraeota bacterium]